MEPVYFWLPSRIILSTQFLKLHRVTFFFYFEPSKPIFQMSRKLRYEKKPLL